MTKYDFDSTIFHAAPIGLARVGTDGTWLKVNPRLAEFLGYPAEKLQRLRFHDVTHPDDLEADVALVDRLLRQNQGSYNLPKRYVRADGTIVSADLNVRLLHDAQGRATHFVSAIQDISALQKQIERLEHKARLDTLTRIANRAGFFEAAEDALRNYHRRGTGFALVYMDLDGFKTINDTFGHTTGDALLTQVAGRLAEAVGRDGLAARLGGDEFAIVLNDVPAQMRLIRVKRQLQRAFARPVVAHRQPISITASIGFAHCPTDARSLRELLQHADMKMYASKNAAFSAENRIRAAQ